MKKTKYVDALAAEMEMSRKDVNLILECQADVVCRLLANAADNDPIPVIPGVVAVRKSYRAARTGTNPQTGEPMRFKAKRVVKARVLKQAKDCA